MLIVTITSVTSVNAIHYTADDTTNLQAQYHDIFNNYFSGKNSYKYFTYKCTYGTNERNCYYGIDSKGNYLKIDYLYSSYNNYTLNYTKGVDNDFSVTGVNVYEKDVNEDYTILFCLCFGFTFIVINEMFKHL